MSYSGISKSVVGSRRVNPSMGNGICNTQSNLLFGPVGDIGPSTGIRTQGLSVLMGTQRAYREKKLVGALLHSIERLGEGFEKGN